MSRSTEKTYDTVVYEYAYPCIIPPKQGVTNFRDAKI